MNRAEKRRERKLSEKASQKTPELVEKNISNLFAEALQYQKSGHFKKAKSLYKKIIKINSDFPELHTNLGSVYNTLGNYSDAEKSFRYAIVLKPDYADAHSNLGNVLSKSGRLDEAEASYRQAIAINPDYVEAYSNLGAMLQKLGKLDEAEANCRQAVLLSPSYIFGHNNLGLILQKLDRPEEAEVSYRLAISLKSDFAEAHSNLGITLKELNKLDEAEASCRLAIALKSNFADAHNNLGIILQDLGRSEEAIEEYKKALKANPKNEQVYHSIYSILKNLKFSKPNPDILKLICKLLEKEIIARPIDISIAAISLLKFDPTIKEAFKKHSTGNLEHTIQETIVSLSNVQLLLKLMETCPLPDLEFEAILKDIRAFILLNISNIKVSSKILIFQSALALQCFTNEYLYDQTDLEIKALVELGNTVEKNLVKGQQPSPSEIACLASYKTLNDYSWFNLLLIPVELRNLHKRQILEPEEEKQIRSKIPILNEITDIVSSKVQEQYEQNPYPRWIKPGLPLAPKSISTYTKDLNLRILNPSIYEVNAPKILIAGCGTGIHSITTACTFKDCEILAIDLSLSSLAYAKRKTQELRISNIEYLQADILDLRKCNTQFDIIESVGVLHHMDDPMVGLKVLIDCLKPGGIMRIGLYSSLARKHIVQLRDEIEKSDISSSNDAMKSFRKYIVNLEQKKYKTIVHSADFYSLSMFRDLLFHVKEHQFTILQIKECFTKLGMDFCGIQTEKISILQKFKSVNPSVNAVFDLNKWFSFEIENPHIFSSMYNFWYQKA